MLTFYISMLETEEQQDKFSYIYQNYVGFMYHVAKEVVKEHYLAEDVVHETFLQLIRIIDKVHIDDELTLRAFCGGSPIIRLLIVCANGTRCARPKTMN